MRLAISWSVALALLALVACTLLLLPHADRSAGERRSIALLTAGWLAQLGIRQALGTLGAVHRGMQDTAT